jgi:hypothetical protein
MKDSKIPRLINVPTSLEVARSQRQRRRRFLNLARQILFWSPPLVLVADVPALAAIAARLTVPQEVYAKRGSKRQITKI